MSLPRRTREILLNKREKRSKRKECPAKEKGKKIKRKEDQGREYIAAEITMIRIAAISLDMPQKGVGHSLSFSVTFR